MKIYNPKGFTAGIGLLVLGIFNLYLQLTATTDTGMALVKDWGIIIACLLAGSVMLGRALSHPAARADRLDERDERNQLVRLKANDRTLKILIGVLAVGALTAAIMTHNTASSMTRGVLGGIALTIGLTFWIWLGSTLYYEHRL